MSADRKTEEKENVNVLSCSQKASEWESCMHLEGLIIHLHFSQICDDHAVNISLGRKYVRAV